MNKLVLFVTLDSATLFEIEIKDANTGETTIISFGFGTSRSKMLSLLNEMPERGSTRDFNFPAHLPRSSLWKSYDEEFAFEEDKWQVLFEESGILRKPAAWIAP